MSHRRNEEDLSTDRSRRKRHSGVRGLRTQLLALVMLASLAFISASGASATQDAPAFLPSLTGTAIDPAFGGTVVMLGANFTPGGDVFIQVSGSGSADVHQTRWATASDNTLATNGSSDPALGFHPGGVVHEVFVRLCEHPVSVRAFDQQSGTWSNLLDLDTGCVAD